MIDKKENINFLLELFVEVIVGIIAFLIILIPAFLLNKYIAYFSNLLGIEDSILLQVLRLAELAIVITDVILLVIFSFSKIKKTVVRL